MSPCEEDASRGEVQGSREEDGRRTSNERAWRLASKFQDLAIVHERVAHDLRAPLNAMSLVFGLFEASFADLPDEDLDRDRHLATLKKEFARLRDMLDAFASAMDLSPREDDVEEVIDLVDLVRHVARVVEPASVRRRVRVESRPGAASPVPCLGVRRTLEQAVLQLVLNAIDATEAGGRVVLALDREQGDALVRVEDSGSGVLEGLGDRIWEPYVSTKPGHLGLGLPVACRIIAEHGGRLTRLEKPDGPGAIFEVRLPVRSRRE